MELSIGDIRTILVGWRDQLSAAIVALDPLMGEPMPAALVAPPAPPDKPRAIPKERPVAEQTPRVGDVGEAILAALRRKSPQQPSELAVALKWSRPTLTRQIKPLLKRGAIVATGATGNRQFSLPRPAKEAP